MEALTLVINPGSASRKYALYEGEKCLIKIHFEYIGNKIVYTTEQNYKTSEPIPADLNHLTFATIKIFAILQEKNLIKTEGQIKTIALRVVAPSSYFQKDRLLDKETIDKLTELEKRASLHINVSLQESHTLKKAFPKAKLVGVSDSAFHLTVPEYARNYGIPQDDAGTLDIRRFGYHGLSIEAVVSSLRAAALLPIRLIVCHLGSGASVTAIRSGHSIDTTMGYSPLEGLMMSTRSGSIDVTAAQVLQDGLSLNDQRLQDYLNHQSGLLGVSGVSSDIRVLLKLESEGKAKAKLALDMYVYRVQQAIGQMTAILGGVDALVFTGTVGERSAPMRKSIIEPLLYLGLSLDLEKNHHNTNPYDITQISPVSHPGRVYIIPTDEYSMIAKHAAALTD